ncbi:MAG: UDP-N-acetylglucosamine 1-carboxyvinyltransferase [Lachnospiraceae bacterium]|nr:UDP-N-acetylglucosamine 1-carboxyvinyltransferase [Lachnospiraceae bacterium]
MCNRLQVRGNGPIYARLQLQGSKNGTLPCMAAALLHSGTTVLEGVPMIADVLTAAEILRSLGASVHIRDHCITIQAGQLTASDIPRDFMGRMRSSVIFMGALLARCGETGAVSPGGCVIGRRPIDYHLDGFRQMGASVVQKDDRMEVKGRKLKGCVIVLPGPSVGATENLMLASTAAEGITIIRNAAREPEITELAQCLRNMGFGIYGDGTSEIVIRGCNETVDSVYSIPGDRIAAGTWLLCCMQNRGELVLDYAPVESMAAVLQVVQRMGGEIHTEKNRITLKAPDRLKPIDYLETAPYPGFPTDMQSLLLPVLCRAEGSSCIRERVFSSRFRTVGELEKMGADICITDGGQCARIRGGCRLHGTSVDAPDLRGGAALIIAALGAEGITVINDTCHIQRGYEQIPETIRLLGGEACWLS